MAKKDTYLALLRRGIDETTSQLLSESGLKIGDLKKLDEEKLVSNYGIKTVSYTHLTLPTKRSV